MNRDRTRDPRQPSDGSLRSVDLHLHSTASDGTTSPEDVVKRAAAAGLAGMALTDHDTVEGLAVAAAAARSRNVRFLQGAELSANEPDRSIHLLAYGFDVDAPELLGFMREYREDRIRRATEMVDCLNGLGLPLTYGDVQKESGTAAPTRAHVARALVGTGLVRTISRVFRDYLSRGRPAFVEKRPTPPSQVIEIVHAAGGVVVLAHPGRDHGEEELRRWVSEGLDGVEVLHPANPLEIRHRLANLADELGLLKSGGSDWHGPGTHRSDIGSEKVPEAWFDAIRARCAAG